MKKGISSLLIVLLVLIAAGIGTGGYILVKQTSTTTTSSTTTAPTTIITTTSTTTTTSTLTTTVTNPTCEDSDGGINYYVRGFANPCPCTEEPCPECGAWIDKCLNGTTLLEYSCDNLDGEIYTCPYGCEDGACLSG